MATFGYLCLFYHTAAYFLLNCTYICQLLLLPPTSFQFCSTHITSSIYLSFMHSDVSAFTISFCLLFCLLCLICLHILACVFMQPYLSVDTHLMLWSPIYLIYKHPFFKNVPTCSHILPLYPLLLMYISAPTSLRKPQFKCPLSITKHLYYTINIHVIEQVTFFFWYKIFKTLVLILIKKLARLEEKSKSLFFSVSS